MIKKISVILTFLVSQAVWADVPSSVPIQSDATQSQVSAELYERLSDLKALDARFVQVLRDHEGYATPAVEGRMRLERPSRLHWETFDPQAQLVVSDGETLWVYDPDLEQVSVYSQREAMSGPMTLLAQSQQDLERRFDIQRRVNGEETHYVLEPKHPAEQDFTLLTFAYDEAGTLTQIVMEDRLKQSTTLSLSEVEVNPNFSDALFRFVIPEGVDVVHGE